MNGLAGRTALVTGASRGIGAGIAERLAAEGAKVAVNYRSNEAKANELVARIEAEGGEALALKADVGELAEVETLVRRAVDAFGGLDILVNNAGWADFKPLGEITEDHIHKLLNLNVTSLIFAAQHAVKHMKGGGRIINISSVAAKGGANIGVYGAAKAAVIALTKSFAAELGPRGVTVNSVAPGAIHTDLYVESGLSQLEEAIIQDTPLGRIGTPFDVAEAVAFLASEGAGWITGEVVQVSGGRAM